MVSYIQGYNSEFYYGRELNHAVGHAPHPWVCVTDLDTMFLYEHSGTIIERAIKANPDATILSGYTNRCAHKHQLVNGIFSEDADIENHYRISAALAMKHQHETVTIDKGISGFLMIFRKSLIDDYPFQPGIRNESMGSLAA